ncbi:MAG: hypothetical protein P1P64_03240 [Treponemataceae bacterium]
MFALGFVTFVFFTLVCFFYLKNRLGSYALVTPPPPSINFYRYNLTQDNFTQFIRIEERRNKAFCIKGFVLSFFVFKDEIFFRHFSSGVERSFL